MIDNEETQISRAFVIGSIIWAIIGFGGGSYEFITDASIHINELGDYFAGWFAPLAFAWFMYAVFMQRKELIETRKVSKMQNDELAETRKVTEMQAEQLSLQRQELEGSRKALEAQSKALHRQNVENTFFNLIKSLSDVVEGMSHGEKIGRAVILNLKHIIQDRIARNKTYETYYNAYLQDYNWMGSILSHYFRIITNILKFIASNNMLNNNDEAQAFAEMLKAHLSDDELILIFGHIVAFTEEKELRELVIKYHILEYMPNPTTDCSEFIKKEYEELGVIN